MPLPFMKKEDLSMHRRPKWLCLVTSLLIYLGCVLAPGLAVAESFIPGNVVTNGAYQVGAYDSSTRTTAISSTGVPVLNCVSGTPDNAATLAVSGVSCYLKAGTAETLYLSETGAATGQMFVFVNESTTATSFPDQSNVLAGAATTLGQYDAAIFIYSGAIWYQIGASDN